MSRARQLLPDVLTALILAMLFTGCERAKTRLDREVDRLCAIDGGVHIYETVTLPEEDFGPDGEAFPQYRFNGQGKELGPNYRSTLERRVLIQGDPELVRSHVRIIRNADEKVLAERINYHRGGGDLPGPWNPSGYSCGHYLNPPVPLMSVFKRGEKP